MGHNINLMSREMINGVGKKKEQGSATQICTSSLDFSTIDLIFSALYFMSLSYVFNEMKILM